MVVDIDKIIRELIENNNEFEIIYNYDFVKSLIKYNCKIFEDYLCVYNYEV